MDNIIVVAGVLLYLLPISILTVYGSWLSIIDLRTHRLPNRDVALLTVIIISSEVLLSVVSGEVGALKSAIVTALMMTMVYAGLYLASRGSLGMGDVKYSAANGLVLGYYSAASTSHLSVAVQCVLLTFVIGGIVAIIGMLTGKLNRKSRIAFGPFMTVATVLMVAVSSLN